MTIAARLRHRVLIEERVEVQDSDTGAISWTWAPISVGSTSQTMFPAEVLTGPGREVVAAGAVQSEVEARATLRWFPGLTSKHRVVWQGVPYDIVSIETDATDRREYRLKMKKGASDG